MFSFGCGTRYEINNRLSNHHTYVIVWRFAAQMHIIYYYCLCGPWSVWYYIILCCVPHLSASTDYPLTCVRLSDFRSRPASLFAPPTIINGRPQRLTSARPRETSLSGRIDGVIAHAKDEATRGGHGMGIAAVADRRNVPVRGVLAKR